MLESKSRKGIAELAIFGVLIIIGLGVVVAHYVLVGVPGGLPGQELKRFSSCEQIKSFLQENTEGSGYYSGVMQNLGGPVMRDMAVPAAAIGEKATGGGAEDYSATNVQVEGVDEPDIVKNDGKYIYTLSGSQIFIIDAYPAESGQVLSAINSTGVRDIFINGGRLVVFGSDYGYQDMPVVQKMGIAMPDIYPRYSPKTYIHVYDISDRSSPELVRNVSVDGDYFNARMIGDYVYAIINNPVSFVEGGPVPLPLVYTEAGSKPACGCADLYYFDFPDYGYQFVTIASINVQEDSGDPQTKVIMSGYTENMYVSSDNIYISYMKRISYWEQNDRMLEAMKPILPAGVSSEITEVQSSDSSKAEKMQRTGEIIQDYYNSLSEAEKQDLMESVQEAMQKAYEEMAKETEKTVIHKIGISNGGIEYKAKGEVPGRLLNQFSMDENNGYLRVATTTSGTWNWRTGQQAVQQMNHVYVLDAGMQIAGKLEDLAPGESIYSARFIGSRGYLVTFKKIDPLFVIDLSDPNSPELLGKLKIPGYSDYLHPYDENHIIGIGKEAVEAEGEMRDFAWYQGVKLALFDVSDPENPKEVSKYEIGDRGTDSYALHDHKAFLFSKDRSLLVIPILLAEIDESQYPEGVEPSAYGEYTFQGAYVFSLDLNGFQLKGRVTHVEDDSLEKSGWYWYSPLSIQRSLYIGENLYTVSQGMVKANSLSDLSELKAIKLPVEQEYPIYPLREGGTGGGIATPPETTGVEG